MSFSGHTFLGFFFTSNFSFVFAARSIGQMVAYLFCFLTTWEKMDGRRDCAARAESLHDEVDTAQLLYNTLFQIILRM